MTAPTEPTYPAAKQAVHAALDAAQAALDTTLERHGIAAKVSATVTFHGGPSYSRTATVRPTDHTPTIPDHRPRSVTP